MSKLIRPVLKQGARIALISPSSGIKDSAVDEALAAVKKLGMTPVEFPGARAHKGFLAGSDEVRAADINNAFADDSIDGIWALRGGYGSCRVLPMLDYKMIAKHPKFFGGFSDITAYIAAFTQNCGFVCYHCIMPGGDILRKFEDMYSIDCLRAVMSGEKADYFNPEDYQRSAINGGKAEGALCGGNLSLLAASLGTPWEIDAKGKLLFIEEVGEKPYRVDGFLTHLRNAGKFEDCAGVLLGQFTECEPAEGADTLTLDEVFDEIIGPSGKPVIKNVLCGHCAPSLSLPMGVKFTMDADALTFGEE